MSQAVRDLRWAIESPSLIAGGRPLNLPVRVDAADLEAFLSHQTSHRVGHYFENLIHYWLLNVRCVKVVAQGLQLQDGTRTVGEIDFLFHDEDNQLTHLETAVKFYLYLPGNDSGRSCFIGPNPTDDFEQKIRRLFDHQLPVSQQAYPNIRNRVAFVKGRVFYHPDLARPAALPKPMAGNHLQNTWLFHADIGWFHNTHAQRMFHILRKPYWLSDDVTTVGDQSLLTASELIAHLHEHFSHSKRPYLVSVLETVLSTSTEVDRVFVVDDSWPRTEV